ncbi:hypothetical protein [Sphingomonas morindae]|uniref:Uncharacterized protein n=1 Tax=Sphingomonas morindae TaxID=1541170 RepID=A0ABY4XFA3_9SPHN|nr:hypothetical protein [Sphingomonas morindae]USI75245.1 hypothetical protein LHA26_19905 [Sphingomonas morindae]
MKTFRTTIIAAIVGATALGVTTADAQSWGYDTDMANRAYRSADERAFQARRDQHAADAAAYWGDYAAADAYAHAADVRRTQAWRDARFAHHENNVARWDYWHGGWGY